MNAYNPGADPSVGVGLVHFVEDVPFFGDGLEGVGVYLFGLGGCQKREHRQKHGSRLWDYEMTVS